VRVVLPIIAAVFSEVICAVGITAAEWLHFCSVTCVITRHSRPANSQGGYKRDLQQAQQSPTVFGLGALRRMTGGRCEKLEPNV
jgi:hypothetical protein